MPQISVIVPVYKVEAYLGRCVDSILRQTFQDFELILVDDGSPDSCGALCEEYAAKDSRIHVIHQENGGLSAARNSGIDYALQKGESQWLAFVDSDDWVAPEFLQRLYAAVQDTGCRISVCGFFKTSGEEIPGSEEAFPLVMGAEEYYCTSEIHEGVTMVAWNKLYHVSLFESLRYPQGKLHEDEFTSYLAVYQAGQAAVLPEPLYAYYQNPAGIMGSQWSPRRMHSLEALEQQMAFAKQNDHPQLWKKAAKQYIYTAFDQFHKASQDPQYRDYVKTLRRMLRWGLREGRRAGVYSEFRFYDWAFETAYPYKFFWWGYSHTRKLREGRKHG